MKKALIMLLTVCLVLPIVSACEININMDDAINIEGTANVSVVPPTVTTEEDASDTKSLDANTTEPGSEETTTKPQEQIPDG